MRHAFHLAAVVCALWIGLVLAGERIVPTVDYYDMRVIVRFVSAGSLATLQAEYGGRIDRRDLRQDDFRGFSRLRKNSETGALTCEIFLPDDQRPRRVDDSATLSIGHELLHCMFGDYHQ